MEKFFPWACNSVVEILLRWQERRHLRRLERAADDAAESSNCLGRQGRQEEADLAAARYHAAKKTRDEFTGWVSRSR